MRNTQVLERVQSDAEQALPGGAAAVRLKSLLAEANANTRVRVAVVAPQQGQGGSATAAQLTQLFARCAFSPAQSPLEHRACKSTWEDSNCAVITWFVWLTDLLA